jgi:hypothetical protein
MPGSAFTSVSPTKAADHRQPHAPRLLVRMPAEATSAETRAA